MNVTIKYRDNGEPEVSIGVFDTRTLKRAAKIISAVTRHIEESYCPAELRDNTAAKIHWFAEKFGTKGKNEKAHTRDD